MLRTSLSRQSFRLTQVAAIIFLLIALSACQSDTGADSFPVNPPAWAERLDKQVSTWVDQGDILGAELLIIQHRDTVLHTVRGTNDVETDQLLQKDQIYRIHSMTKPLIGTAVLMLAEQGRLDLKDRAAEYVEPFDSESCDQITIAQLLYHTAGFSQPAYPRGSIDLYSSLKEAVADLAAHGPEHEPGKEYHYSDGNTATLGLIIGRITGMPLEDFLHQRLFAPLGMHNTHCDISDTTLDRDRLCNVYMWRDGAYQMLWDHNDPPATPFFRASGGVVTTTSDYARFLSLWMNGGRTGTTQLLQDSTIAAALAPSPSNPDYGTHWEIYSKAPDNTSLPVFGHGGSSGTVAIALPEEDAMVLYFSQSRGTLTGNFLTQLVLQELGYREPKDITPVSVPQVVSDAIAGEYFIRDNPWTVVPTERGLKLISNRLVPIEFVAVSDTFYVQPYLDWDLSFSLGDDGTADHFVFRLEEREVQVTRGS